MREGSPTCSAVPTSTSTTRLAMKSTYKLRPMPLSTLPWPHIQFKCRMGHIVDEERIATPDIQAAHAAAFLSRRGRKVMASCPYHQPDWRRLVRILQETAKATSNSDPHIEGHPEYALLSNDEKRWLCSLVTGPIVCEDQDDLLTDGQHRLCALRAAGVTQCLIGGNLTTNTAYGAPITAAKHAHAVIKTSWLLYATKRGLPAWVGAIANHAPRWARMRFIRGTRD
jgi:hypothetical protein